MKRKINAAGNEVSELVQLELNGFSQKVLIEGRSKNLPVVITLHGGPGFPVPFSVGCRGLFPEFTDRFIMVYWDQLGCGINDHVIDDTFSIDTFVKMTRDLVLKIKDMFPDNKIILFSTSWGSILSAELLAQSPCAVDAVIAVGQIVKNAFLCDEVFDCLERSGLPSGKLDRIRQIKAETLTMKEMQLISGALKKYTDAYQNKTGKKAPVGKVMKGLLTSPDYSLKDFKAIVINGYTKNLSIWREILRLDLSESLKKIEIPYVFLQGDTDIVASTQTVKNLVESSDNPNLKLTVVPNTGHLPSQEMMETLLSVLSDIAR